MDKLPYELLFSIATHLDSPKDSCSFSRVSSLFLSVSHGTIIGEKFEVINVFLDTSNFFFASAANDDSDNDEADDDNDDDDEVQEADESFVKSVYAKIKLFTIDYISHQIFCYQCDTFHQELPWIKNFDSNQQYFGLSQEALPVNERSSLIAHDHDFIDSPKEHDIYFTRHCSNNLSTVYHPLSIPQPKIGDNDHLLARFNGLWVGYKISFAATHPIEVDSGSSICYEGIGQIANTGYIDAQFIRTKIILISDDALKVTCEPVVAVDTTTTNQDAMLSQRVHRVLQNYLLVWLDANMDESKKDFKNALKRLRHIVTSITIFTNARQCIDFIREINNEKVFMIVSGSLGQHILPTIHEWPQLDSVYVFCRKQSVHEQWAKTMSKVKGVHNHAKLICEALQIDCERCDQAMISMSFRGIDVSFMYTQLFKEAFLKIDYDDTKSIQELVEYCRLQDDIPEDEIKKIEQNYRDHTPIWWYTAPYFIYSMLNRGLRTLDIDIILKIGFFIRHLYEDIEKQYHEQQSTSARATSIFEVYRGQVVLIKEQSGTLKHVNGIFHNAS
ncbi:unnamed protein product [Rotaria sp. Silwood1]|nr:unnamed protein product [Rotaria sp. Silwood1]